MIPRSAAHRCRDTAAGGDVAVADEHQSPALAGNSARTCPTEDRTSLTLNGLGSSLHLGEHVHFSQRTSTPYIKAARVAGECSATHRADQRRHSKRDSHGECGPGRSPSRQSFQSGWGDDSGSLIGAVRTERLEAARSIPHFLSNTATALTCLPVASVPV